MSVTKKTWKQHGSPEFVMFYGPGYYKEPGKTGIKVQVVTNLSWPIVLVSVESGKIVFNTSKPGKFWASSC